MKLTTVRPPLTREAKQAEIAKLVENFKAGERLPIEKLAEVVDLFKDLDAVEIARLGTSLRPAGEKAPIFQRDVWDKPKTAEDLARLFAQPVKGRAPPVTPRAVTDQMSDLTGTLYGLREQRRQLDAGTASPAERREKSDALNAAIEQVTAELGKLHTLSNELEAQPKSGVLDSSSMQFGPTLTVGLPGVASASVYQGFAIEAADRHSGKRQMTPFTNVQGSAFIPYTGVGVSGGYTASSDPERRGWSFGASESGINIGRNAQDGNFLSVRLPLSMASLRITERGGFGVSASVPVIPFFVSGGLRLVVEHPALGTVTRPILSGVDVAAKLGTRGLNAAVRIKDWVAEHVGSSTPTASSAG